MIPVRMYMFYFVPQKTQNLSSIESVCKVISYMTPQKLLNPDLQWLLKTQFTNNIVLNTNSNM